MARDLRVYFFGPPCKCCGL